MNLQPRLLRFVNRFYKRDLDPRRAGQIWREYDEDRRYAEYLSRCRTAFRRAVAGNADMGQLGFT
jgi:hypothetical protein